MTLGMIPICPEMTKETTGMTRKEAQKYQKKENTPSNQITSYFY
jgi:hypothetical protein